MSVWRPSDNKVYLPPPPVSKVVSTDEYVQRTNYFYHASSSRLLVVGHPYYSITKRPNKTSIPKVSGLQYRVFRVRLPDPNKFTLPETNLYNPDTQRMVWACVGLEVGRGQPLGVGISGHPLLNKLDDTENAPTYGGGPGTDNRENVSMDYKQTQLCLVGCKPAIGEHWGKGTACTPQSNGDCPPLELKNSFIQDGDMVDVGFGALDFGALQSSKAEVPLDIVNSITKYPDYLKMSAEAYGDSMFFFLRREQMFVRHLFNRAGTIGEPVPDELYTKAANNASGRHNLGSSIYYPTPSGSMVTSDAQLFNKPYWLQQAQGHNNGICWGDQLFLTVVDTTRSTNMTLCATATSGDTYTAANFKEYLRHAEEYDVQFIFQLCKITLTVEVMSYIHNMNPNILEEWNVGVAPPPSGTLEDSYRYVQSEAIRCQAKVTTPEKKDPYSDFSFWEVNLSEKFSTDLDQFPLGRKFLLQAGLRARPKLSVGKRKASTAKSVSSAKRKKTHK
uniref:Major capsid protein L1 n=7 Tax=Papillomaviridae TaxID=151340 RepID=I4GPV9_HPV42|nr:L1 protein [human papillomavirus 42]CCI11833.1 L1 protein [human papillomavirus 42]CCI11838.1 L1 protein [human papillomavirus 42]CCI11842.1 L1 protein [human papillomavirus 42]CCI11847.1 L1 protein [human papillomavirus 42]